MTPTTSSLPSCKPNVSCFFPDTYCSLSNAVNDIAWGPAFSTPHTHLIHWHWHLTGIQSHESGRLWLLHRRRGSNSILCSHLHCGWPFPHVCSIWDRRSVIRYCEIQETPLRRRYYLTCVTPDVNIPSASYRPLGPTLHSFIALRPQ